MNQSTKTILILAVLASFCVAKVVSTYPGYVDERTQGRAVYLQSQDNAPGSSVNNGRVSNTDTSGMGREEGAENAGRQYPGSYKEGRQYPGSYKEGREEGALAAEYAAQG